MNSRTETNVSLHSLSCWTNVDHNSNNNTDCSTEGLMAETIDGGVICAPSVWLLPQQVVLRGECDDRPTEERLACSPCGALLTTVKRQRPPRGTAVAVFPTKE